MSVRTFSDKEHKQTHRFKTVVNDVVGTGDAVIAATTDYDDGFLEWEKKVLVRRLPRKSPLGSIENFLDQDNGDNDFKYADNDGVVRDAIYLTYPVRRQGTTHCKFKVNLSYENALDNKYTVNIYSAFIHSNPMTSFEFTGGDWFEYDIGKEVSDYYSGQDQDKPYLDINYTWFLGVDNTYIDITGNGALPLLVIPQGVSHYGYHEYNLGDAFYFFPDADSVKPISGTYAVVGKDSDVFQIPYGTRLYIISKENTTVTIPDKNGNEGASFTTYVYRLSFKPYDKDVPGNNEPILVVSNDNFAALRRCRGDLLPYEPVTFAIRKKTGAGTITSVEIGDATTPNKTDECRFIHNRLRALDHLRISAPNLLEYTTQSKWPKPAVVADTAEQDFSAFNTCESMFENCYALRRVHPIVGAFTNVSKMFKNCHSLRSAPIVSSRYLQNASSMYENCLSLVDVSSLHQSLQETTTLTNVSKMFKNCRSLFQLQWFKTSAVTHNSEFIYGCHALQQIPAFDFDGVIPNENTSPTGQNYQLRTTLFTSIRAQSLDLRNGRYDASTLNAIFAKLYDATAVTPSPIVYIADSIGASTADISIATARGWNVNQGLQSTTGWLDPIPPKPTETRFISVYAYKPPQGSDADNPLATEQPTWQDRFSEFSGVAQYAFVRPSSGTATTSIVPTYTIPFDPKDTYELSAYNGQMAIDRCDADLEFLDADNNVIAAISLKKMAGDNYKHSLLYGPSLASLTKTATSGYNSTGGTLTFAEDAIVYTNTRASQYNASFTYLCNTPAIKKLRVSNASAVSDISSNGIAYVNLTRTAYGT